MEGATELRLSSFLAVVGKGEKMEGRILRAVVILFLASSGMVVAVAGQSSTIPFQDCYAGCFLLCIIVPPHSPFTCGLECLRDCINVPQTTQTNHFVDNHRFCKLGCASSICANISTKQNPNGERVESCVGSCSKLCTKNYLSP